MRLEDSNEKKRISHLPLMMTSWMHWNFSLRKEHSSVQSRMDDALKQLYEQAVPEAVREYLDSKAAPAPKPKRTAKAAAPKAPICEPKPAAVTVKGGQLRWQIM